MNTPAPLHRLINELFPEARGDLRRLLDAAVENSGLLASDYMTVRDLVELSGYADDEPLVALLLVLLAALDEGSLCVEVREERLALRLAALADPEVVGAWPKRIADRLRASGYPELIADADRPDRPLVRHRTGPREFLYFQKAYCHERELAALLRKRLQDPGAAPSPASLRPAWRDVIDSQPLRLNSEQRLAVALALLRPFVLVSGGPGTGKTTIVLTLLRGLARLPKFDPERVALAAPTGRAAQRLTDATRQGLAALPAPAEADRRLTEVTAQTVHRLLGYNPERGTFRHHAENPLALDTVVVDEVSMVGLELMSRLFQALPDRARVVLLGDKDQLPSVDAGAVLAHLTVTGDQTGYSAAVRQALGELEPDLAAPAADGHPLTDALVVLERNHRSQADIQKVARAINAQRAEVASALTAVSASDVSFAALEGPGGCFRLEGTTDPHRWGDLLRRWAEHHYRTGRGGGASFLERVEEIRLPQSTDPGAAYQSVLGELFAVVDRARVLTVVREGAWGCVGVNEFLVRELRRRLDPAGRARLFPGAMVLVVRNDYELQLFNGDVGLSLRAEGGGCRVVFPRVGGYVALPAEALPAYEYAFAMTVHKAQGSEYEHVLVVLPPQGARRLLTKEILYTGVTRARHLAVLCGSAASLQNAIGRRVEREANLLDPA